MTAVYEHLGYNRHGLRYITPRELREQKRRVLNHNFSPKANNPQFGGVILWFLKLLGSTIARQEEKKLISQRKKTIVSENFGKTR